MEIAGTDDDFGLVLGHAFDLVAPFSGGLDGRFHRFGAGVHQQAHFKAAELRQLLEQRPHLVITESAGSQSRPVHLGRHRFDDFRMAVALIQGGVGAQAVQVFVAFDIVDPHPFTPFQNNVQGVVIVGAVGFF